ncbi:hypothetical protein AN958_05973 [Leucoagaricus sp. SymC.cos]|nr:hypothetical protein AN958_05973 [Leucoagaricus sp. SymC.cos]
MKHTRGTFSGLKTTIIADQITIVGFECSYKGRHPTTDTIGKILHWEACKNPTNVHMFLGTAV